VDDQSSYPRPVSDPEAEGLPDTADDDSSAYDDADSARIADGPDPAALPADEPVAVFDYGTTPAEARTPEPLEDRLAREEPDIGPDDIAAPDLPADDVGYTGADPTVGAEGDVPASGDIPVDADAGVNDDLPVHEDLPDVVPIEDAEPTDLLGDEGEPLEADAVGRLVQADEGAHRDVEGTEIALDAGAAGGGLSAEEAAMHSTEVE
jgi:Family of unknown function (DUF5709)